MERDTSSRGASPVVTVRLHGLTIGLCLLAAVVFGVAQRERSGVQKWFAVEALSQAVLVVLAAGGFRRWALHARDASVVSPVLVLVVALTWLWEPVGRWLLDTGRPLEIVMMTSMQTLMLGLAAAACWRNYEQLAGLVSLFLVLFAATLVSSTPVSVLIAVYSAMAVWWMAATHWDRLRATLLASNAVAAPRPWIVLVPAASVLLLGAAGLGANRVLSVGAGWLPSSGGNGKYDPFAEQGVGDGDALVAGMENIQSFAPIEDAPFRASDEPSLYDLFNDAYEEPVQVKQQDRAVALPAEFTKGRELQMSQSERASREFSTLRRRGKNPSAQVGDLTSNALFYVAGRTPLHLRLEVYDLFDGIHWLSEPAQETSVPLRVDRVQGRPWIVPSQGPRSLDLLSTAESHAVKIVNLDTSYIPAPLNLRGVHVDLVESESMFQWSAAGLVRMDRRRLPALVPIHLTSLVVDSRRIDRELHLLGPTEARYGVLPTGGRMPAIAELAGHWGGDQPRGWKQISTVVARLREACALDREALASDASECPVADFLLDSHRGPDYQFATAAALLLRSLGYSTRVVSGFYADPKKFDARSRHTPVERNDVHFWTEVYLGVGIWQTVEPTPGYEVLAPPLGVGEQIMAVALAVWKYVNEHAAGMLLALVALAAAVHQRIAILDSLCTFKWRVLPGRNSRTRVLQTLRLLERRMEWAGLQRPVSRTPAAWFCQSAFLEPAERAAISKFFELVDWAAFAPARERDPTTCLPDHVSAACSAALTLGSVRRLLQARGRRGWRPEWLFVPQIMKRMEYCFSRNRVA